VTSPHAEFPVRFRRRIAVAFVVVAGLSAGALAVGASVTVYSYRTSTFRDRAREQARDDLRLLAAGASPEVVAGRLADAEQPGGPAVLVVTDGQVVSSVETLDLADVPASVRTAANAEPDALVESRTTLASGAALVIGSVDPASKTEVYFFFPREELERSLRELLITLGVGLVIVVAIAGVAGTVVARRTLRPVSTAADAARRVAEGLLDTRLPVDSSDEFGAWAAAFNEMVGALGQKIDALAAARDREKRFAADVAHELRTPIASALTAASHLAENASRPPQETKELSEIIVGSARRLDRLTSELLELHRLESGHETLQIEEVDLATAVQQAARAHGWLNVVDFSGPGSVLVETDRRRLDRINVNHNGNGIDHGGGRVHVDVRRRDGGAIVEVHDDGPGIAPSDLNHVFDRHYKASSHRSVQMSSGSGLGLSIALESAQHLGGSLTVQPGVPNGATFTLLLPERPPDRDGEGGASGT
jgi:two-component system sensor histidine kinase MtrB